MTVASAVLAEPIRWDASGRPHWHHSFQPLCDCYRRCGLLSSDPRHGTANGYGNLNCRCAGCCRANTVQMRDYRNRRRRVQATHDVLAGMVGLLAMPHVPDRRRAVYAQVLADLRAEHWCDRCPDLPPTF